MVDTSKDASGSQIKQDSRSGLKGWLSSHLGGNKPPADNPTQPMVDQPFSSDQGNPGLANQQPGESMPPTSAPYDFASQLNEISKQEVPSAHEAQSPNLPNLDTSGLDGAGVVSEPEPLAPAIPPAETTSEAPATLEQPSEVTPLQTEDKKPADTIAFDSGSAVTTEPQAQENPQETREEKWDKAWKILQSMTPDEFFKLLDTYQTSKDNP